MNVDGRLLARVAHTGEETALARISLLLCSERKPAAQISSDWEIA